MEEYIQSGRDKSIVDPDPNVLYTKRKQQRRSTPSASSIEPSQGARLFSIHFTAICLAILVICPRLTSEIVSYCLTDISFVTYPDKGWSTSLTKMPMFTKAEMNEHITRSAKHIANKDHHSVPTSLRKATTFLEDKYLHEIMAASDQHCFYFKAKCCHSFRENDPPHSLKLGLCIVKGDVLDSNCTCVAGKVGFCNHISALMLKICKFTLFEAKSTKDLCEEKDENPELACTSQLLHGKSQ